MMVNCPVCGKLTCIHWPEHWVYKRGKTYYCSEQCLDVSVVRDTKTLTELHRRRKELVAMANGRRYIKPEERDEALELYKDSGKQAAVDYLTKIGIPNPEKCLKNLLARFKDTAPAATVKVDGPLKIETDKPEDIKINLTPEGRKIVGRIIREAEKPLGFREDPEKKKSVPLQYDGYTVRCIEGKYGKFYWDYEYNRLDWTSPEGEEVSLSPEGWKTFCTEIMPKVMAILGVVV